MEHVIRTGADALFMNEQDHVVTALREIRAGETIQYRHGAGVREVKTRNDIPFGHKIAVAAVESGSDVRKYGEVIGRAVTSITVGQHVHVHNIEGIRGRGDLGAKETN